LERLRDLKIPFVLVGRFFEDFPCDFVVTDDEEGGFIATQYLIEKGHRRIACISGPLHISSAKERLRGYYRAMRQYDIPILAGFIHQNVITLDDGYQVCMKLLSGENLPTAIFAYSDYVAAGSIRAIHEKGKRLGIDISIIGYDDIDYSLCFEKPLTTIHIPKKQLADRAVSILCKSLKLMKCCHRARKT
jgi:DNA-binding LacI/PurR family transcriptional regulator